MNFKHGNSVLKVMNNIDTFLDGDMADKRTGTGVASWIDSSTADATGATGLPVTEIAAPSTLQFRQPSNTSMATQLASSCPPISNLGGEQNSGPPGRESSTVPDASVLQSASTNLIQPVNDSIIPTPEHSSTEQLPNFLQLLRSLDEEESKLDALTPLLQPPTKAIDPELYSAAGSFSGVCSPGLWQVRDSGSATGCNPTQPTKSSTTPTLEPAFERLPDFSELLKSIEKGNRKIAARQATQETEASRRDVTLPGTMHITSHTDFWSKHAVIGIASQSKPSSEKVHLTYPSNAASPLAVSTSQRQHQEDVYLGRRTRDFETITLSSQSHSRNVPPGSYTPSGLIKVYKESLDFSSSAESSTPRLDNTASFSGDVRGTSHSGIGLFAGNKDIVPVDTPSQYTAEAPSPTKYSSLSTDDMEKFCQLVAKTRISRMLTQEQLASILCESYRAPFPKKIVSVRKFERGMFSAQQMLILYPIFKEWIEGERSNDSPRRSISPVTFSRLGRSGKRLSQAQYGILRHEFGRDPKPSEQKEIDLASRFGVQQGVIRQWYINHRSSNAGRIQMRSTSSTEESKDGQTQTEEELRKDEGRDFRR